MIINQIYLNEKTHPEIKKKNTYIVKKNHSTLLPHSQHSSQAKTIQ